MAGCGNHILYHQWQLSFASGLTWQAFMRAFSGWAIGLVGDTI